jgi:hypothetical protein
VKRSSDVIHGDAEKPLVTKTLKIEIILLLNCTALVLVS